MKLHVVKEPIQTLTPSKTFTHRAVIQRGFIIQDVFLVNTTETDLEFRFKLNGLQIIHPVTGEENFALQADTALQLPKEFYVQSSRNPIIFDFETSIAGVEVCFIYFEPAKL